jgi:hypothetical protein
MRSGWLGLVVAASLVAGRAGAVVTTFFSPDQTKTSGTPGVTSDTIFSMGYSITYTMDKLWSPSPGGEPTGRFTTVNWPAGIQAQAVTVTPPGVTNHQAQFTIRRVDGGMFDLPSFTFKLLANTAGAGGSVEVMPRLNGEDALNDPVMFFASGYYGQSFHYDESTPSYLGNTNLLKNCDTYKFGLYVDFALTSLTLVDNSIVADANGDGLVDSIDFTILSANYGRTSGATYAMGDFNYDTKVNTLDFNILAENFNPPAAPLGAAVPEPGALMTLGAGCVALVRIRRMTGARH